MNSFESIGTPRPTHAAFSLKIFKMPSWPYKMQVTVLSLCLTRIPLWTTHSLWTSLLSAAFMICTHATQLRQRILDRQTEESAAVHLPTQMAPNQTIGVCMLICPAILFFLPHGMPSPQLNHATFIRVSLKWFSCTTIACWNTIRNIVWLTAFKKFMNRDIRWIAKNSALL
jgi:hypothetical protein